METFRQITQVFWIFWIQRVKIHKNIVGYIKVPRTPIVAAGLF